MLKISPFLWFDGQAEEAMNYYVSIFPNSKAGRIMRWGDVGPGPKGSVLVVSFELDGQEVIALNGGPRFKFSEAISLYIHCKTQEEVDYFWEKLSAGGSEGNCGWLKDKYGLSWQVAPDLLLDMLHDKDAAKAGRAMQAMMTMNKIDIATLQKAYDGN